MQTPDPPAEQEAPPGQEHLSPSQEEMPFAMVQGEPLSEPPKDLYIPPDALEVFLEAFAGPLDLLLYLIKRQNLDVLDIPIAEVTRQYMVYVEMMKAMRLELAAEYLVMAAMLAEIKSRMLLPRPSEGVEEEDPRAELVRRLQEYERFKQAASDLDALPRLGRDVLPVAAAGPEVQPARAQPVVELRELLLAMKEIMARVEMFSHHHVQREALSVRERMTQVLTRLRGGAFVDFVGLFEASEGRMGVVVTFLAVMELLKARMVEVVQNEPYGPLHVRAVGA